MSNHLASVEHIDEAMHDCIANLLGLPRDVHRHAPALPGVRRRARRVGPHPDAPGLDPGVRDDPRLHAPRLAAAPLYCAAARTPAAAAPAPESASPTT